MIVCSFTGSIGEMTPRDQKDDRKVLAVLKASPSFTVFDATERPAIANTLDDLKARGLIEYPDPQPGFPWSRAALTAKGEAFLLETGQ